MPPREWEPGDVALVRNEHGVWNRAICSVKPNGDVWQYGVADSTSPLGAEARPLVVIDPGALDMDALLWALDRWYTWSSLTHEKAAIRVLFDQLAQPVKPTEPQGLGAVVEDAEGKRYIRTADTDCRKPWSYANNYSDHDWADIAAVKVLSEGVPS